MKKIIRKIVGFLRDLISIEVVKEENKGGLGIGLEIEIEKGNK